MFADCLPGNSVFCQKILIGVGVVLSVIVVGAVLSCCCCGCCACCRSEPRHSTVLNTSATTVVPVNYAQPIQTYPVCQGYQPVPAHLPPGHLPMTAAPYSNPYTPANQNQGQPPSYQEAASAEQPLCHTMGHPSYISARTANDNPTFVDVVQPGM
ncbi:protein shisa-5-like isoform X2 [Pristis pectinata]|uniref:protein shisa-5-like isoform X2 n=1 Tax=Pristis pectinata TaxID=685728 RepID=UPI00223D2234|nr:protein shisa-5-like isoform X2 [Pristis pectinata]